MTARARSSALTGDPFDGYTDVTPLYTGLHSGVFQAVEEMTGRPVALKMLAVDGVTPRALERFSRESAVLAALSAHPNIVTLFRSFALPDGRPVLVLELCRGSIEQRLRAGTPLTPREAVAIAIKTAGALATAHRGGVLHRDVRPANLLITDFGEPALADFGVARLRSSIPAPAELFDFPSVHVAPELMMGQEPSEATDVYGLASTLYELLAGHAALEAYHGESPAASILRILRDPARPILRDGVPLELSDLVLWGLAKDASARPPSVMWFAEELGRIETSNGWTRTRNLVREPDGPVTEAPRRRRSIRPLTTRPPSGPGSVRARRAAARAQAPAPVETPAPNVEPSVEPSVEAELSAPAQVEASAPEAPPAAPRPELSPAAEQPVLAPPAAPPVPAIEPPLWAAPLAAPTVVAAESSSATRQQLVLRAPLLSALGTLLAIAGPIWAAVIAVLAITAPSLPLLLGTLAGAVAVTAFASWFARPTLVIETCHMQHRDLLARVLIPWTAVLALKPEYEPSRRPGAPHGLLVVVGRHAQLPLTATRRSTWELPDLIALLEMYREADATHHHG